MKILWLSDFDMKGSGYYNISVPLCSGLEAIGHDVKVLGMHYKGEEHPYNFSILPVRNAQEIFVMIQNLHVLWKFDVFVCALDIIHQEKFLRNQILAERKFPYVGIMPIESDPLVIEWAMVLMQMDKVFIISEFGMEEAKKAGVEAEHLQIGVSNMVWHPITDEEKEDTRNVLGLDKDDFVVLTVADNQERKNLASGMEIFSNFAKDKKAKYVMVTREHNLVGWKLRSYASTLGIADKILLLERGMELNKLRLIYGMSDIFFLPSKAEGLGIPLLEAMATGIPCIGTNCTGIKELLSEDRGILVDHEYKYVDPFGNGHRYLIDKKKAEEALNRVYESGFDVDKALKYTQEREWIITLEQMEKALAEVKNENNGSS
jgi:glycosyltransferase involved in cell wall biosynthesis